MAVVRNKTDDVLDLLHRYTVRPNKEVEVTDDEFVDRAWPKSTWALVKKPAMKGRTDASTEDAYIFLPASAAEETPTEVDHEENR